MTVLLYGGETWSLLDKHLHQLSVFHMRCSRRICDISLLDHITNSVILKRCETFSVDSQLRSKRLRWFGHICRMADSRLPKLLMHGQLVGQNCRGRPRTVWNDVVLFDIHKLKLNRYTRDALNKPVWRESHVSDACWLSTRFNYYCYHSQHMRDQLPCEMLVQSRNSLSDPTVPTVKGRSLTQSQT